MSSPAVVPGQPESIEAKFVGSTATAELTWKPSSTGGEPSGFRMFAFYEEVVDEQLQQQSRRRRRRNVPKTTVMNISEVWDVFFL